MNALNPLGLMWAVLTSMGTIVGETMRKRIMAEYNVIPVTIAYRSVTSFVLFLAVIFLAYHGQPPGIVANPNGGLLALSFLHASPLVVFIVLMTVVSAMLCCAQWLHLRAYQLAPISTTYPLISLTAIFLVPASIVFFHQSPTVPQFLGIVLLVAGTFGLHANLLSAGWLAPLKAVFTDRGSRYMLGVAAIFTITNLIEKQAVGMSGPWLEALVYAVLMVVMFTFLVYGLKLDIRTVFAVVRRAPLLVFFLGLTDAFSLVTQYLAQAILPVYVTVSIKRAGIIVIVLVGWLVFKEKGVGRKALGVGLMLVGVVVLNVPMTLMQAVILTALGLGILVPLTLYAASREQRVPLEEERLAS